LVVSYDFFFSHTATSPSSTLSLHDALPIFRELGVRVRAGAGAGRRGALRAGRGRHRAGWGAGGAAGRVRARPAARARRLARAGRSEEHTSELQSRENLVCRLLLEKKKKNKA